MRYQGDAAGDRFEHVRAVADAILYEGYLLYPYRQSSQKNRVRWQFGVLAPRDWAERSGPVAEGIAGSVESWQQQTECLFEQAASRPSKATVHIRIRYLQLQSNRVERRDDYGRYIPVESIDIDGTTHVSFDEAVSQESEITASVGKLLRSNQRFEVGAPACEEVDDLGDGRARLVRQRWPVTATTTLRVERLGKSSGSYRLRVHTENTSRYAHADTPRSKALRHSLIATHALIAGQGLQFLSLIAPPDWATAHVRSSRNIHTFPVLARSASGESSSSRRDTMLSSPILLYDDPQIAPENPGELRDFAGIDEVVSLRTLTTTPRPGEFGRPRTWSHSGRWPVDTGR